MSADINCVSIQGLHPSNIAADEGSSFTLLCWPQQPNHNFCHTGGLVGHIWRSRRTGTAYAAPLGHNQSNWRMWPLSQYVIFDSPQCFWPLCVIDLGLSPVKLEAKFPVSTCVSCPKEYLFYYWLPSVCFQKKDVGGFSWSSAHLFRLLQTFWITASLDELAGCSR